MTRSFEALGGAILSCGAVALTFCTASLLASASPPAYAAAAGTASVKVQDVNGDGKPDLITANLYANTVSVLLGEGDGSFRNARHYRAAGDPRCVAIGDLNSDGRPDLAAVNADANRVSVLLNNKGTFKPRRDFATGAGPLSVAIGDLDGDGKPDIATAGRNYAVSVLLNKGEGRFTGPHGFATGSEPVSLAIGDLNGDGRRDLVTANYMSNSVSVLLNKGHGGFQRRRDYRVGSRPMALAVGDLNGDRMPDLATANLDASSVSVLLNARVGSFRSRKDFPAGGYPRSIAIGDLDGDGRPDLVTTNAEADSVSILRNRGHAKFAPFRKYAAGRGPVSVAVADLNRDGKDDVVTGDLDAGAVSVILGSAREPSPPPPVPSAPPPPANGLLLWNKLGSAAEISHSAYGPNLRLFACGDRTTPTHGHCGIDVPGLLAHPQGVFGSAAAIGGGPYASEERVHAAVLRSSILNPEHGTVEAWYGQKQEAVPFEHDQYRIFGGPYSLAGIDEANLYGTDGRLHFALFFGEEPPPFVPPHLVAVRSLTDGRVGYRLTGATGRWLHLAGVRDRRGIAGTSDTVRLYVDGVVVATSKDKTWGTTPCGRRVSARPAVRASSTSPVATTAAETRSRSTI
jgi:VCBS repeat protein